MKGNYFLPTMQVSGVLRTIHQNLWLHAVKSGLVTSFLAEVERAWKSAPYSPLPTASQPNQLGFLRNNFEGWSGSNTLPKIPWEQQQLLSGMLSRELQQSTGFWPQVAHADHSMNSRFINAKQFWNVPWKETDENTKISSPFSPTLPLSIIEWSLRQLRLLPIWISR